jgi:hypothetical protein
MAIEPGDGAAPEIAAMGILAQAMALARIDDELAFDAALDSPA